MKNDMIRVLEIVSGLDGGGVESMLLNYIYYFDKEKIQVDFAVHSQSVGKTEAEFEKLGCKIYRVTPKTVNFGKNIIDLYKLIKIGKYDVVHSHFNIKGITHLITAWFCGVKIRIIHTHRAYVPLLGKFKYLSSILKFLCKVFATHWFACSSDAGIEMFGKKDFDNGKVTVIKNAIEAKKFNFDNKVREKVRKEFGFEKKFVVGMVARFHEQKNHLFLIDIFNEIININLNSVLLLVGDGELNQKIHEYVKDHNLQDVVFFTGIRSDVNELMQAMDVFVLPTQCEGLGIVLIESQAAGLKTYTSLEGVPKETKITDLIEYISLSKSPEYWANEILKSNNNYQRLSEIELIKASGYDISSQAKILEDIYLYGYK